jgi:methyl-accepting chemotaxis protein
MRLTLKTLMRALFATIIVGFAALGGFAVNRLGVVNEQSTVMEVTWLPQVRAAEQLRAEANEFRTIESRHILSLTPEMITEADRDLVAANTAILTKFTRLRGLMLKDQDSAQVDAAERAWRDYVQSNQEMLALSRVNRNVEATAILRSSSSRFSAVSKTLSDMASASTKAANASSAEGAKIYAETRLLLMITVAAILLAGAAAAMFFERAVSRRIIQLADLMNRLAGGDNAIEAPTGRQDEIGEMAGAVQVFKDAAIEKLRLEGEAAEQRRLAEEERARNEATNAEVARQQALVVDSLATGLEKLSSGNLVFRLNEPFAPNYEKLRADFNGAMDQLQETMKVILANTQGLRSGTEEISQASDDLSKRTEQQAASLEETAAALDEITATVRKTSEGANHARDVVAAAAGDAERSGQVVQDAVTAMSEIEKSAQQISQIIGVIDEIAFQTNLLALNAGVEAARAGDAGRGFAVVASEVRALAQRSADAAKEIKTLISASTQQVGAGVNLVGETGLALTRIAGQVADINTVVSEIAASAQEQATGLHEVNTAVNQMDQVTQQNAAMVEESTAASHNLAQETEQLARLVGRFQVGEAASAAPARREARPATRTALKTVSTHASGGGALRKPDLVNAGERDAWEEF